MIVKAMKGLNLNNAAGKLGGSATDIQRLAIIFSPYVMGKLFVGDKAFNQDILLSCLGNVFMMVVRKTILKQADTVTPTV